jgi:hypothetical protein
VADKQFQLQLAPVAAASYASKLTWQKASLSDIFYHATLTASLPLQLLHGLRPIHHSTTRLNGTHKVLEKLPHAFLHHVRSVIKYFDSHV